MTFGVEAFPSSARACTARTIAIIMAQNVNFQDITTSPHSSGWCCEPRFPRLLQSTALQIAQQETGLAEDRFLAPNGFRADRN
jgi:hypothetical protein